MSDDLPAGKRMWELSALAIKFESTQPGYEHYKIAEEVTKLPLAEQRFFQSCLDYDSAIDYEAAVKAQATDLSSQQWMFDRVSRMEANQKAYVEEKKEVSRSELESPNRWIERMADLAGDVTVDRARIGEIIRREQAPVRTMRARATHAEGRESRLEQLAEAQRQRAHEPPGMETMRSVEIQPSGGSHYILVDGKEWSRHDSLKVAEQVRDQLIRDVWVARDQVVDQWYRQYEQAARDGGREEIQR